MQNAFGFLSPSSNSSQFEPYISLRIAFSIGIGMNLRKAWAHVRRYRIYMMPNEGFRYELAIAEVSVSGSCDCVPLSLNLGVSLIMITAFISSLNSHALSLPLSLSHTHTRAHNIQRNAPLALSSSDTES